MTEYRRTVILTQICVQRNFLAMGGSITQKTHLVTVSQRRFTVRFTDGMIRELVVLLDLSHTHRQKVDMTHGHKVE